MKQTNNNNYLFPQVDDKFDDFHYHNRKLPSQNSNLVSLMVSGFCLLSPNIVSDSIDIEKDKIEFVDKTYTLDNIKKYNEIVTLPLDTYKKHIDKVKNIYKDKQVFIRQIVAFKSLDNSWDGYGAVPLEVDAASNAIFLLNTIGKEAISTIEDIYPNPHGTVSITWENAAGEDISVEIGNKVMSYYVNFLSQEVKFINNVSITEEEISELSKYVYAI